MNSHIFSSKYSQTNVISKLYQAAATGICWFSVVLMERIIKVFFRSAAQAVACGSHCGRGSEAEGYLWIPHWFPCDWCGFWELLWYLYSISCEYMGTQVTTEVWTGSQGSEVGTSDGCDILQCCPHLKSTQLSHTSCFCLRAGAVKFKVAMSHKRESPSVHCMEQWWGLCRIFLLGHLNSIYTVGPQ